MNDGQKLKLGDASMSPQEVSKKYKHQILGIPKASPSSSIKLSGHLSRRYIFIASYNMCYSWGVICFLFSVLFSFLCCSI
jgi:hypothetical protein